MLHGRASLRPGDVAFTFTDYADDPAGVTASLTWAQLSRCTFKMALDVWSESAPAVHFDTEELAAGRVERIAGRV